MFFFAKHHTNKRCSKCIDYENLLDIISRQEGKALLKRQQYPNGFQENAELRDVLAQHVAGIKKKQVEKEDTDFIYLNDDRKK